MIKSYPKIYNLGHADIQQLFLGQVIVEEKIDGSQFSMMVKSGELLCRSKGVQINLDDPGMFDKAVETALLLKSGLVEGHVYRCEYLRAPRHNTIVYERAPSRHLVLFDIELGEGTEIYADAHIKSIKARDLGIDCAPFVACLYTPLSKEVKALCDGIGYMKSLLGASVKPEGLVFKNYGKFGADKKILIGKYVRSEFKEENAVKWNAEKRGKTSKAILETLVERYRTDARWSKAIQHLREAGQLESSMRDIPKLMKEVPMDVQAECKAEILDALWAHFWPQLSRQLTQGLPEFYKDHLAFK